MNATKCHKITDKKPISVFKNATELKTKTQITRILKNNQKLSHAKQDAYGSLESCLLQLFVQGTRITQTLPSSARGKVLKLGIPNQEKIKK